MNMRFLMIAALCSICSLQGAALPEQPVRDIKKTKLYAAICAKVQQHLLPPLAEKVAEYCDNDFPLVEQRKFVSQGVIRCANFFDERYLLVGQGESTQLTVVDLCSDREVTVKTPHRRPLTAMCRVRHNLVATGSEEGIYVWDIKKKTIYKHFSNHSIGNASGVEALFPVANTYLAAVSPGNLCYWNLRSVSLEALVIRCFGQPYGVNTFVPLPDASGTTQALGNVRDEIRVVDDCKCQPWTRQEIEEAFAQGKFVVYPDDGGYKVNFAGEFFQVEKTDPDLSEKRYSHVSSVRDPYQIDSEGKYLRASVAACTHNVLVCPSGMTMALVTKAHDTQVEGIVVFKETEEIMELEDAGALETLFKKPRRGCGWCY